MHKDKWDKVANEVDFNLEIDLQRFSSTVLREGKILDYGCGYGRISKQLWDHGYKNITGIDSSPNMIERGNREYPFLELSSFSGNTIPFPDKTFDAVVVCAVFTCITSKEARDAQFKELFRVLKSGGLLHMVEFCSESSKAFTSQVGVPMLYSSPQELKELADAMQLINEEVIQTKTMGGRSAGSYRLFARKSLGSASSAAL